MPRVNPVYIAGEEREAVSMWTLLIILLILWAGVSVLGFVIKGLFWLAIVL